MAVAALQKERQRVRMCWLLKCPLADERANLI
jgi:hypothetical protein